MENDKVIKIKEGGKEGTARIENNKLKIEFDAPKGLTIEDIEKAEIFSRCEGCSGQISYAARWLV